MSSTNRRLRAGIVGGGRGAFIGTVHRIAAELDGEASVVAGAMSADPANARASATNCPASSSENASGLSQMTWMPSSRKAFATG